MSGHIISIIGGKGGVGKSMLACNLAFAYASETKANTLLLDFDKNSLGDQYILTGIKPKKTIKDLADFNSNLDPRIIQNYITMHPQKLGFLGMTRDATSADQINVEALGKHLKSIKNIFPITIIDVGSELNSLALKALEFSTLIFVDATPDLLVVNQTRRICSDLITMLFPKEMIFILMNQYQKGHPVSPEILQKQVGRPVFSIIPKDDPTCIMTLTKSQPAILVARNSAFSLGVLETVKKIRQKNVLSALEKMAKPENLTEKKVQSAQTEADTKSKKSPWVLLKERIHKTLVEEMDLKNASDDKDPKARLVLREQTKKIVVKILNQEDTKGILNGRDEMNQIVKEILDEALGLGPLEDLLSDRTISEIMVNGPNRIYYEQSGKIKTSTVIFTSDRQVLNVIERIVAPIGRRIDEKTPYVDARLHDGSRVHAIIPPCAIDGCTITIRKFPDKRLDYKDLINFGSINQGMADFLRIAVEGHRNIVVSGGTGSGKTTLINVLGSFIPGNERIITVEDSAELSLPQEHVVRLETRPPTLEGEGEISIRLLVKQTLRMRPDRIIVGECRGGETLDMLQAMNTGHDGSLTTVHSNNPRDCMGRLEALVQFAGAGLNQKSIREMIASAVHMVVQQSRLEDGSRRVTHITEIGGMQGDIITLQDIFVFKQEGMDKKGKIVGKFEATGFIPSFVESLEKKGYKIPRSIFSNEN